MVGRPNVILYVADSLRADRCSHLGYERPTTPRLDDLADDGITLENAFAQAYKTVESSVSIVTGLYPDTHGARSTHDGVPERAETIAEVLHRAGYDTAAFTSMVQVSRRRGFDRGFDTFEQLFDEEDFTDLEGDSARACTDGVLEWLDRRDRSEPFFAFAWSNGTHDPYSPRAGVFSDPEAPPPLDGSLDGLRAAPPEDAELVRDLYDDTVRHTDTEFGRLVDGLQAADAYDDTLIIFTADHGELLAEHGRLEHARPTVRRGLQRFAPRLTERFRLFERYPHVGHLATLPYDELLNVPMVVKLPRSRLSGIRRGGLAQLIDLVPTIAETVGVELPTEGRALQPLMNAGTSINDYVYSDTAVSYGTSRCRSVRSTDHKYITTEWVWPSLAELRTLKREHTALSLLRVIGAERELLFDVADEGINLAGSQPEALETFRGAYADWVDRFGEFEELTPHRSAPDQAAEQQLTALGYR